MCFPAAGRSWLRRLCDANFAIPPAIVNKKALTTVIPNAKPDLPSLAFFVGETRNVAAYYLDRARGEVKQTDPLTWSLGPTVEPRGESLGIVAA